MLYYGFKSPIRQLNLFLINILYLHTFRFVESCKDSIKSSHIASIKFPLLLSLALLWYIYLFHIRNYARCIDYQIILFKNQNSYYIVEKYIPEFLKYVFLWLDAFQLKKIKRVLQVTLLRCYSLEYDKYNREAPIWGKSKAGIQNVKW